MASLVFHAVAGQTVVLPVTSTAVRFQLPACCDLRIYPASANTGEVFFAKGIDNTVTAVVPLTTGQVNTSGTITGGTLGDMPIPPGGIEVTRGPNKTGTTGVWVSLVAASGTQTAYITPGDGL